VKNVTFVEKKCLLHVHFHDCSLTHFCNMGNMCFKEAHYFYMMTTTHVKYLTSFLTVCYSILVLKVTYFKCAKIYWKHDI